MILVYAAMAVAIAFALSRKITAVGANHEMVLVFAVIGVSSLILPVQIAAAMQITGFVTRITIPILLMLQSVFLIGALLFRAGTQLRRVLSMVVGFGFKSRLAGGSACPTKLVSTHLRIAFAVVALTYATFVLRAFFAFPEGFDALAYHYPTALRWLQDGSLSIDGSTDWRLSLPGNVELLAMLTLATGHDRALPWIGLPALFTLLLSVRLLMSHPLKTSGIFAPVAVAVLTLPMISYQAFSGYVDLFGTSMLFASTALLCASEQRSPWLTFSAGLACGLAVGTKPTFWPLALLIFAGFAAARWRKYGWRSGALLAPIGAMFCGVMLTSMFWFARGWYQTGNPFYPMRISILGYRLQGFPTSTITSPDYDLEFVRNRLEWLIYPWTEWVRHPGYLLQSYSELQGLGAVFATFVIPGVAYAVLLCVGRRARSKEFVLAALLLVLALMWWFVYARNLRFVLALQIVACLLSASLFRVLERWGGLWYKLLFLSSLIATCAVLSFEPIHAIASTVRSRDWSRAQFFDYPKVIDQLPPQTVLLNLGLESDNFPLAGAALSNRVIGHFEAPAVPTGDWLRSHHVSYIVQQIGADTSSTPLPPSENWRLVFDEKKRDESGNTGRWLIWRTQYGSAGVEVNDPFK